MILYFADRKMNIVGQASTELPGGISILDDKKVEDVETGVATFETYVQYDDETRKNVEECTSVGNYILRSDEGENEFYTIIESESDTKNKEIYVYAEDAGLDLINQTVGAYAADQAYPIAFYINKFAYDSGFEIGINEASDLSRKLSWEGESTVTERLASVATQFDNCEISYSFEVKNLEVTRKFINIYKKRGKNDSVKLRLNKEIDRIQVKKSIANLATALEVTGGIPENEENPITLKGYTYDDGDFYVKDGLLCSRSAKEIWSRYVWNKEPNKIEGESGHIIRQYSYDTTSQSELCNRAITELKKLREIEVNYEVDIATLPNNVKIGDTVNVIDEAGEMYLQTRLLKLEKSVVNKSYKATLGEFLLKNSDINEKVADLAKKFAENSLDAKRALNIANSASAKADNANTVANSALNDSNDALTKANEAITKSETATQSAQDATAKANEAKTAVESVQSSVESIQTTVDNASTTAQNAWTASQTAQEDATTAKEQAAQALTNANEAKTSATTATEKAESAITSASSAITTANTAKSTAEQASATASAAKADAEQAQKDIDEFGQSLETLTETMTAEYARKTELTEAQTTLQTQISKNAAGIASNASQITIIDETANNAKDLANSASTIASEAQTKADEATANATAAQTAADEAKASASAAQTNADNAKKAADDAAAVASKAQTDLEQAQADLATVQGRVDATEQDIADAQAKVEAAQTAADKAKEDAKTASEAASAAQSTADIAKTSAANAQTKADQAAADALNAQQLANTANGNATAAQTKANEAAQAAANAQSTADTAKANAETAQAKANEASQAAVDAQSAADAADAKAQQAATDLATAQQNLVDVTSRVDATEEEIATAQAAVDTAQKAADAAKASAATAQSTADTAKANAATAQNKANEAKTAADNAQSAADAAKEAADKAQADADALAVRVTTAETNITQNAEQIALRATKTELSKTDTKATNAQTSADTANSKIDNLQIGGRNLLKHSSMTGEQLECGEITPMNDVSSYQYEKEGFHLITPSTGNNNNGVGFYFTDFTTLAQSGDTITFSFDVKGSSDDNNPFTNILMSANSVDSWTWWSGVSSGNTFFVPTNAFQRVSVTFTIPTDANTFKHYDIWLAIHGNLQSDLYIKNLKLEKGNKATDWTPAPEDVEKGYIDYTNDAVGDATVTITESYESLIEETAKQINLMIQQLTEITNSQGTSISTMSNQLQLTTEMAQFVKTTTKQLQDVVDGKVSAEEIQEWARFDGATLELGASNQPFKAKLSTTELAFYQGNNKVAWISNNELHILTAIITKSIGCGNFTFIDEGDLGFSLL